MCASGAVLLLRRRFADYLKVHRTFVGQLETGRKDFPITTLIRIGDVLEVPLADLFIGLGTGGRSAILRELRAVKEIIQKMSPHIIWAQGAS